MDQDNDLEDLLVVKFKFGIQKAEMISITEQNGAKFNQYFEDIMLCEIAVPAGKGNEFVAKFNGLPEVEFAELNIKF